MTYSNIFSFVYRHRDKQQLLVTAKSPRNHPAISCSFSGVSEHHTNRRIPSSSTKTPITSRKSALHIICFTLIQYFQSSFLTLRPLLPTGAQHDNDTNEILGIFGDIFYFSYTDSGLSCKSHPPAKRRLAARNMWYRCWECLLVADMRVCCVCCCCASRQWRNMLAMQEPPGSN